MLLKTGYNMEIDRLVALIKREKLIPEIKTKLLKLTGKVCWCWKKVVDLGAKLLVKLTRIFNVQFCYNLATITVAYNFEHLTNSGDFNRICRGHDPLRCQCSALTITELWSHSVENKSVCWTHNQCVLWKDWMNERNFL